MKALVTMLIAALFFAAFGCGKNGSGDSTLDAGVVNTDADSDADSDLDADTESDLEVPATCPAAIVPPCKKKLHNLSLWIEAIDFGENIRFVSMKDGAILAEKENADGNEILLIVIDIEHAYVDWTISTVEQPHSASLRAVSLTMRKDYFSDHVEAYFALLCGDDECAVYQSEASSREESPLVLLSKAPPLAEPRGLHATDDEGLLLFGNGVWNYDGEWMREIEALSGARINALVTDRAVADEGRIFEKKPEGWQEMLSGTEEDLLTVTAVYIGGTDGRLGKWRGESVDWFGLANEPILHVASSLSGWPFGVTSSGCAFRDLDSFDSDAKDSFCILGIVPEKPIEAVVWHCADATNLLVLTEYGVYAWNSGPDCFTYI
ncbi:MAG: hypothetical protein GY854_24750 [Deltaproteobacteria bacterium]|nr:hypothetical protein [Deltaproteobacteria bacterium]